MAKPGDEAHVNQVPPEDVSAAPKPLTRPNIADVLGRISSWKIDQRGILPAYVQLAVLIRRFVVARKLQPGALLPSEPELTEYFSISRDTVRRSMQLLRDHGLVETKRGKGHFVLRAAEIQTVYLQPGSEVFVRMPLPEESLKWLSLTVFVVAEPGKAPVVYEPAVTDLIVPR